MKRNIINEIERTYEEALSLLDDFDHQRLDYKSEYKTNYKLEYEDAIEIVNSMKYKETSSIFGIEKDNSFKSSISTINQTFDSVELYPSIEEKASHLLYFIVKNHSFIDGNKRIAACVFLYYLYQSGYYEKMGKLDPKIIVSLTIMIAVSDPKEKEMIIKLVTNLL